MSLRVRKGRNTPKDVMLFPIRNRVPWHLPGSNFLMPNCFLNGERLVICLTAPDLWVVTNGHSGE
eukprot:5131330-Pyramimonas_sp.AAC.1